MQPEKIKKGEQEKNLREKSMKNIKDVEVFKEEVKAEEVKAEEMVELTEKEMDEEVLTEEDALAETATTETAASETPATADGPVLTLNREQEDLEERTYNSYETMVRGFRNPMHRPVLSSTIDAYLEMNGKMVVVSHHTAASGVRVRVLIPVEEMDLPEETLKERDRVTAALSRMTGLRIEFIATAVSRENKCILASRRYARERRRLTFYRTPGARTQIVPGRLVQARIMDVSPYRMRLDVFGVETVINKSKARYAYCDNLQNVYKMNDTLLVRVTEVELTDDRIRIEVTGRVEKQSPDLDNFQYLVRGHQTTGVVTGVSEGKYYLRLNVGVNAIAYRTRRNQDVAVGSLVTVIVQDIFMKDQKNPRAQVMIDKVFS